MDLQKLIQQIKTYTPCNAQEVRDKAVMLDFLRHTPDALLRENPAGHFTASGWVVNRERTRVLMVYHNIYRAWSWAGGHADGERNLCAVAMRELQEETGIVCVPLQGGEIFSLEILPVAGHEKNGQYISSHLHYNLTFLLEADDAAAYRVKPDENSGVAWFALEDVQTVSAEPWMCRVVYQKLLEKIK